MRSVSFQTKGQSGVKGPHHASGCPRPCPPASQKPPRPPPTCHLPPAQRVLMLLGVLGASGRPTLTFWSEAKLHIKSVNVSGRTLEKRQGWGGRAGESTKPCYMGLSVCVVVFTARSFASKPPLSKRFCFWGPSDTPLPPRPRLGAQLGPPSLSVPLLSHLFPLCLPSHRWSVWTVSGVAGDRQTPR